MAAEPWTGEVTDRTLRRMRERERQAERKSNSAYVECMQLHASSQAATAAAAAQAAAMHAQHLAQKATVAAAEACRGRSNLSIWEI